MLFTLVFLYNEKTRHDRSHAAFKMRYCFLIHPVRKAKATFLCIFALSGFPVQLLLHRGICMDGAI